MINLKAILKVVVMFD